MTLDFDSRLVKGYFLNKFIGEGTGVHIPRQSSFKLPFH